MQSHRYNGYEPQFDRGSRAWKDESRDRSRWWDNEPATQPMWYPPSRNGAWPERPRKNDPPVLQRSTLNLKPERCLPDRIEIRLRGTNPRLQKRWLSIPDLCRVTMHAKPAPAREKLLRSASESALHHPSQETSCTHPHSHRHEHTKEMYVSQYTHHFDPDIPKSHIAGWKCDVEPYGIPHRRSRMCVLNSPMTSGGHRRGADRRPKSAPPNLVATGPENEVFEEDISYLDTLSLKSEPQRMESNRSGSNYSFPDDKSCDDTSSIDYYPSDDASDTSSTYLFNGRSPNSSKNFSLSQPRLLRLSAEFPGVRNLKKMRRKRQSMGSVSTGSQSPTPSPTNGEYGFFVAVTSPPKTEAPRHWHKPKPRRPHPMS